MSTASSIRRMRSRSSGGSRPIPRSPPSARASKRCARALREKLPREAAAAASAPAHRRPRSDCDRATPAHPGARSRPRSRSRGAGERLDLVRAAARAGRPDRRGGRRRPHARADGAAADRRRLVRPPYREAVVQRPHPAGAARRRSGAGRISAGRRAHRRDRRRAGADAGLSPPPACHQRVGGAAAAARRRQHRARSRATISSAGTTTASPTGRFPISAPPISRRSRALFRDRACRTGRSGAFALPLTLNASSDINTPCQNIATYADGQCRVALHRCP